jgi:4-amino-4-deoxychorismate lyase
MVIEFFDQRNNSGCLHSSADETACVDRNGLFGDGFFTTGVIDSGCFLHQELHFRRLLDSSQQLMFNDFNIHLAELRRSLETKLMAINSATIRISIYRRQEQRGYAIAKDYETICQVVFSPLPEQPKQSCRLLIAKTAISVNPSLAGLKHLNRLDSVLAASEITESNQEMLMLNGEHVICGSRSNLFVRLNGDWRTPKLNQCGIMGITRKRVLDAFNQSATACSQALISLSDLKNVDAAFITNSLVGVWPVCELNGRGLDTSLVQEIQRTVPR